MQPTDLEIERDTLRNWLAEGRPVFLLDVRPTAERQEWAIPGSVHIDAYTQLRAGDPQALAAIDIPSDVPVVTICAAGRTSLIAAELLRNQGITAYSLAGGMRGWSLAWNIAEIAVPDSSATIIQVRRTGKGCLSYMIGSEGQAIVIDPSVDPELYQELAIQHQWQITHVIETHLHADHLSRARALADLSGATLALPAGHRLAAPFMPLHAGEKLALGSASLTVLHTPGHTPESMSFLLNGRVLFSGDTLFLAAVGRPDLHADREGARQKAHILYRSLQQLLTLAPETLVFPGHTSTPIAFDHQPIVATLATVRLQIPLLALDETAFVNALLERIPLTPPNHAQIIAQNEAGQLLPLDPTELEAGANRCAIA